MNVLESAQNSGSHSALKAYTQGLHWDRKLFPQEIQVQLAWVRALQDANIVSMHECEQLTLHLRAIHEEMQTGMFAWREEDEDIHMNIERALTERLGDLGKRVHWGRSRNDLIATTLRLHVADAAREMAQNVSGFAATLMDLAAAHSHIIVPGTTHLQHGQPVALTHILLAHAWPCLRVLKSLTLALDLATEAMPLGAAACNGSTVALDYGALAKQLGFASPCRNSYDAVSDRDAMLALMQSLALHATHLGRLCEDMIYWASSPVGLLRLSKNWSTGSSIMPNKRNPDVAEITRAKAAIVIANAASALQLVKSIGTSYYSDLHELKKLYLDTVDQVTAMQSVMTPFVAAATFCPGAAARLLHQGHILATDLAHHEVGLGKTFRDAYQMTAAQVEHAEAAGLQVHQMHEISFSFTDSVALRKFAGGTGPGAVEEQMAGLREALDLYH